LTFDVAAFRKAFPEFNNTELYSGPMVDFWVGFIGLQLDPCIWKRSWNVGMSLYLAHELTLAGQNGQSAKVGGTPGIQGGVATSKTVGSVTVQYDAQTMSEKDAGYWNLTTYGKQFIRLVRIYGAGCRQL
jgi:uncharacterized protein DUF4054